MDIPYSLSSAVLLSAGIYNLKNQLRKVYASFVPYLSWSTHFSKAIWSLTVAASRRIYSSWSLLVCDRNRRESYMALFWKQWDSILAFSGYVMSLFSLIAHEKRIVTTVVKSSLFNQVIKINIIRNGIHGNCVLHEKSNEKNTVSVRFLSKRYSLILILRK